MTKHITVKFAADNLNNKTHDIVLHGGSDLQVTGSIAGQWLSCNIGQLSLASLRGH